MSRKYIWKRSSGYSNPIGLRKLMTVAAVKVVAGRKYVVTQDGDSISPKLGRLKTLSRFKQAISNREVGSTFRIRRVSDGEVVFTARAVQALSDADSTSGNTNADVAWNVIRSRFSAYDPRYAGAYVCKYVSGSTNLSQHSYGNALDVFFDTLTHQNAVADYFVAHAAELNVYHVISGNRIWTKGYGWRSYGGDFHSHLHLDFDPQYSGSCGVRG